MRTKKAKGPAKAGEAASNKRSFADSGLDVRDRGMVKTNIARTCIVASRSSTDRSHFTGEERYG